MPGQARLQDIGVGVCCCHPSCIPMTGMLITASQNHNVNGRGVARIGDIMLGFCGHTGLMITSSSTVFTNSRGNCRIGDMFSGCFTGKIITGSSNQITGG